MAEPAFWRTTPRKLFALLDAHVEVNTIDEDEAQSKQEKPKQRKAEDALRLKAW